MKTLAIYALEVLACSGVLLAAYTILLDRRVKFRWCRLYLLASTAAAALIPLLRIPVWPGQVIVATPTITAPDLADWTAEVLPDAEAHAITPGHLCLGLYLAGATLILGIMLWQIFRIRRLRRGAEVTRTGKYRIVRTQQEIASFSFFRTIYIWAATPAAEMGAILAHESSHIAHRHSLERIGHGNHESRPVVEPLRMDRRTAADRSRGIRGRQRRAHERLRQGRIHANDLQAAFRL